MTAEVVRPAGTAEAAAPERRLPLYLWLLVAVVPVDLFAGRTEQIGLPVSLDRPVLALGLVLLVLDPWAWRETRLRVRPAHVAMAAMVVLTAGSALSVGRLLDGYGTFALVDRMIVPFVLFAVAPVVFCDARRRDVLLKTLVLVGAYLSVTAVLEAAAPAAVVPGYITDPAVGIHVGRARGPMLSSEANGLVLVVAGAAAVLLVARSRGVWRVLSWLVVLLVPVAVLLTLTRSIWLGAVVGGVLACLQQRRLRRVLPVAAVVATLVLVAVLSAVPSLSRTAEARLTTTRSLDDRANVNAAALRVVDARPLTGVGWTGFVDVSEDWVRQADDYPITNVRLEIHNVYLGRAAELGVPGALLWVAVIVLGPLAAMLRRPPPPSSPDGDLAGWRLVYAAGATTWLVSSFLSPLTHPLPNYLAFLLAGVVLSPWLADRVGGRTGGAPARRLW